MEAFPRSRAEIERGLARGWHTGAQVFAALNGQVVADFAVGEARPGRPMATSTIVEWASATKVVTCGAAAMLWQRGPFGLDDPVCQYIPEFATAGKDKVTIRHLLTHTGGLTDPTEDLMPFAEAVAAVCAAPLINGWVPGARCAYNSVGMWIVAELVARSSGRPFSEFVREEMFEPLGLIDSWIGVPVDTFRAYGDRVAVIPNVKESGTEAWVTWGRPTGGGFGPIRDLGRYYVSLLEHRLLAAPIVEAMTTRHLCGVYDERLETHVDRASGSCSAPRTGGTASGRTRRSARSATADASGASRSPIPNAISRWRCTGTASPTSRRTRTDSMRCWAISTLTSAWRRAHEAAWRRFGVRAWHTFVTASVPY
jgi:CubicO group peptidase (beta-lactamase class C family)